MFLLLCFLVLLIPSTTAREFPWVIIDKHQVIFLPEEHTSREDHHFQLEIIKTLHFRGHKFFIAMEMFQQPFQRVLDEYVDCRIEEEELLRRTEYFQRWGYDPAMYRSIWRFAKERGIRMVAINISSELVQRIRREGLEKVRDESLPNPIIEYTERERRELQKVLASHPKVEEKSFFDVQNAWDNGMAYACLLYT
ncbi:MAG: ChaN family lipoprotein, partial [Aquificaceae bacterium]|nr:ChaN family lipoprotein [Aquificaceae bacterium]